MFTQNIMWLDAEAYGAKGLYLPPEAEMQFSALPSAPPSPALSNSLPLI